MRRDILLLAYLNAPINCKAHYFGSFRAMVYESYKRDAITNLSCLICYTYMYLHPSEKFAHPCAHIANKQMTDGFQTLTYIIRDELAIDPKLH